MARRKPAEGERAESDPFSPRRQPDDISAFSNLPPRIANHEAETARDRTDGIDDLAAVVNRSCFVIDLTTFATRAGPHEIHRSTNEIRETVTSITVHTCAQTSKTNPFNFETDQTDGHD